MEMSFLSNNGLKAWRGAGRSCTKNTYEAGRAFSNMVRKAKQSKQSPQSIINGVNAQGFFGDIILFSKICMAKDSPTS